MRAAATVPPAPIKATQRIARFLFMLGLYTCLQALTTAISEGEEQDNERLKTAQGCSMDRAPLVTSICKRAAIRLMELLATFGQ